jgi:hypothetical protein
VLVNIDLNGQIDTTFTSETIGTISVATTMHGLVPIFVPTGTMPQGNIALKHTKTGLALVGSSELNMDEVYLSVDIMQSRFVDPANEGADSIGLWNFRMESEDYNQRKYDRLWSYTGNVGIIQFNRHPA